MRRIRIGIDVGGTFTDAAAIDAESLEILALEKVPTTHGAKGGVAEGIAQVLQKVLKKHDILPEEVAFIAHGTTQATNALLEGDVAPCGIVGLGSGFFRGTEKEATKVDDLLLAPGKYFPADHVFLDISDDDFEDRAQKAVAYLASRGSRVIVASCAFGVDDPYYEDIVVKKAQEAGLYATSGSVVSHLYGLAVRTRTAAVNGSLIPGMMETARMTASSVGASGIAADLMVMKCDGGVMTLTDVARQPVLTMLSGLAAGVAGALMHERMSSGIFLESGGTSTDISAVRDGKVMIKSATVGGRNLQLRALDVRTAGIAGGSLIRVGNGTISGAGPRSAHIASLPYECFTEPLEEAQLELISPLEGDGKIYAAVRGKDGRRVALTLAGAANLLGTVPENDYALGDKDAARRAWEVLGKGLGISAEDAARQAMDKACEGLEAIIRGLAADYGLTKEEIELFGGGGSAGVLVPYLAKKMGTRHHIVKNAPVISTIGVALAMVRESVARTCTDPSAEDLRSIRREAEEKALKSGAAPESIEIGIEFDRQRSVLTASATGAVKGAAAARLDRELGEKELASLAADSMPLPEDEVHLAGSAGIWRIYEAWKEGRGIFAAGEIWVRVLDTSGVVRLKRRGAGLRFTVKEDLEQTLKELLEETVEYTAASADYPGLFAYFGHRQVDLSGLPGPGHMLEVLRLETEDCGADEKILLLAVR